ncbi:MAG: M3 family oligoendopeptidase [Chitinophagales bacterium]|nr:M3 family oligoendopeptidase [Bacteroidota bacterium]MCB9044291.1 M3 family oligoendopeptidase [Chitinophagales bacterium]
MSLIKTQVTFHDYSYQRPDMEKTVKQFDALLEKMAAADTIDTLNTIVHEINTLRNDFETMRTLVSIRHSLDVTDDFYETENTFFDENSPLFQDIVTKFYQQLVISPFKKDLEAHWGKQLFTVAELSLKIFKPEVIEDLIHENQLNSKYLKLTSTAKIPYEGEVYNLTGLKPFMQSPDRAVRRKSTIAYWQFFEENAAEFDEIYDQLVKIRHNIATKLGYKNFVQLGYDRMFRSDYTAQDVAQFRENIHRFVVPLAAELRKRQAKRIGIEHPQTYDFEIKFTSGNPTPKGDPAWIIAQGKKMYEELSPQTDAFFNFMQEGELMDLENKTGKAGGGYCTYLPNYKAPFIFSNFNGTAHDIDVLTHEAGHAFQVYESRHFDIPEYLWPTAEAAEIHSMGMEFFAWPWIPSFFKEDTTKYYFTHLSDSILFLPYGVAVDEFQHCVYENPNMTPRERKECWQKIEAKYLPWNVYDEISHLQNGGMWQRQVHIYEMPFYYIDYTLAQICAFQFWDKSQNNASHAFKDYLYLCRLGGSLPFLNLVQEAKLHSPFSAEAVESSIGKVNAFLQTIDDMKL